tara:strand:- start:335 stop:445 length:111 start_codon:yes stop_codon:yes gene_type:complete
MNKLKRDVEKVEYVMLLILVSIAFSTVAYVASEIFM